MRLKLMIYAVVKMSYRLMLAGTAIACFQSMAQTTAAQTPTAGKKSKISYHFCNGGAAKGCTYPGTGFSVCEDLLRMLNGHGAQEHPAACEVPISDDFRMFSKPAWKEMELQENLGLVYKVDLAISPLADVNKRRRTLTFPQWKELFEKEVSSGKLRPRLLRSQLQTDEGTITVLAYERYSCDRSKADVGRTKTGWHLFVYDEKSGEIDIEGARPFLDSMLFDVLKFSSTYFLVRVTYRPPTADLAGEEYVGVFRLVPTRRDDWSGLTFRAIPAQQCDFRAEFPRVSSQGVDK